MGASTGAERRPVSHPRSSNRTCRFPASGFPTGFTADSRTRVHTSSAELQYSQFAKHRWDAEAAGAAGVHLVTPPQEMRGLLTAPKFGLPRRTNHSRMVVIPFASQ